jgi:hypothetical protein
MYEIVSGGTTQLLGTPVSCTQNTVMRTVVYGSTVGVLINNQYYSATTSLTAGAGGYGAWGVPSGNRITEVEIGPLNTAAPAQINWTSIGTSPFPNEIDMRWQDPTDTTGVGIVTYQVSRSDNLANTFSVVGTLLGEANTFVDTTLHPWGGATSTSSARLRFMA